MSGTSTAGPQARGFNPCVVQMENSVFRRHRNDVIYKIDEDVFVTPGWFEGLWSAWERNRRDHPIISATVPNNQIGRSCLLAYLKAEYGDEYQGPVTEGPVHLNGLYGCWIWDKVLRHDLVGRFHRSPHRKDIPFNGFLNINCIVFGPDMTDAVFPLTTMDEAAFNRAMGKNGWRGFMTSRVVAHHYAFYRQDEIDEIVPMEVVRQYMASQPRTGPRRSVMRRAPAMAAAELSVA